MAGQDVDRFFLLQSGEPLVNVSATGTSFQFLRVIAHGVIAGNATWQGFVHPHNDAQDTAVISSVTSDCFIEPLELFLRKNIQSIIEVDKINASLDPVVVGPRRERFLFPVEKSLLHNCFCHQPIFKSALELLLGFRWNHFVVPNSDVERKSPERCHLIADEIAPGAAVIHLAAEIVVIRIFRSHVFIYFIDGAEIAQVPIKG